MAIKKRGRKAKVSAEQLKQAFSAGKDATEIAKEFNLSLASVYNYKTRLMRAGSTLPKAKRGRKPKQKDPKEQKKAGAEVISRIGKFETYRFIINGITVTLSGKTNNVHIGPDVMTIHF